MDGLWTFVFHLREELLLFSGFWFVIGGLDDLIVDLIWMVRGGWRRLTRYMHIAPMRASQLPKPVNSGPLIIFVAAWQEAAVIGKMLQNCENSWGDCGILYRIYVGCYPNDPDGIRAIISATRHSQHVKMVLCDRPGPTTKADCLNRLWRALTSDELAHGYKAKAVILHDAEDYVHPLELPVYDYLIERAAAVQLPVIPIAVPGSAMVSGHYCDEFAEAHGKSLIVREAIGAAVPLAGVGCAIERNRLGRIAIARHGEPFDADSLTEDYELGLGLGADGGKVIFARMLDDDGNLVGTRACFPASFEASTRQKGAVDDRHCTGRMGSAGLAGWICRNLDASARPQSCVCRYCSDHSVYVHRFVRPVDRGAACRNVLSAAQFRHGADIFIGDLGVAVLANCRPLCACLEDARRQAGVFIHTAHGGCQYHRDRCSTARLLDLFAADIWRHTQLGQNQTRTFPK